MNNYTINKKSFSGEEIYDNIVKMMKYKLKIL